MSRRYVHPRSDDTLESIADRELGDDHLGAGADGADQLLAWNLHLAPRRGMVLPSDIVFLEPPAPR